MNFPFICDCDLDNINCCNAVHLINYHTHERKNAHVFLHVNLIALRCIYQERRTETVDGYFITDGRFGSQ